MSRNKPLIALLLALLLSLSAIVASAQAGDYYMYLAAWGGSSNPGVQAFSYDIETQELAHIGSYGEYSSMSSVAISGDFLFSCVETGQIDIMVSFRILSDGSLEQLDEIHIDNYNIADIALDPYGPYIYTSNFGSCSVSMIRYSEDGKLEQTDCIVSPDQGSYISGHSTVERQAEAYAHGSHVMPDGNHLCLCNMGADKLYIYEIDRENGKLIYLPELTITVEGGEGPRHIVFSEDGQYAYMNSEMGNSVYVYAIGEDSSLTQLQKISTLNPEQENTEKGWSSIIMLSQNQQYLYVANRGQNNIVGYRVGEDGLISVMGYYDCYGVSPRGIDFGYNDGAVFASCNSSGTLTVIEYDAQTGELGDCIQTIEGFPGAAG
ncbi:MAG: beta-propeller fold lactonase family protein, partial [Clostridia bacterium]|nr:beta-propeller fold lactonase family protein [Clostridia bacterium]